MGHADGENPHRGLLINIFLVADSLLYIRVVSRLRRGNSTLLGAAIIAYVVNT